MIVVDFGSHLPKATTIMGSGLMGVVAAGEARRLERLPVAQRRPARRTRLMDPNVLYRHARNAGERRIVPCGRLRAGGSMIVVDLRHI